jgi:GGDEF domain-containing protein
VLGEVARVLDRHGFAGRLGGDEFAVWVRGGEAEAMAVAEAILRDIDVRSSRRTPPAMSWRCRSGSPWRGRERPT